MCIRDRFKAAISKYMAHRKENKLEKQRSRDAPVVPHGKQTVKQLVGQNQGISNIEITDPLGVILPRNVDNLLLPVPVSGSHIGFSTLRMEPCWMALGQAAGRCV